MPHQAHRMKSHDNIKSIPLYINHNISILTFRFCIEQAWCNICLIGLRCDAAACPMSNIRPTGSDKTHSKLISDVTANRFRQASSPADNVDTHISATHQLHRIWGCARASWRSSNGPNYFLAMSRVSVEGWQWRQVLHNVEIYGAVSTERVALFFLIGPRKGVVVESFYHKYIIIW